MKYLDFKRYKFTTIFRRINSKVYDLLKIFKQLPFKRYVISKFRLLTNIDFYKFLNIYRFFDIRKINIFKFYKRIAVPSKRNANSLLVLVGIIFVGTLIYLNIPLFFDFDKTKLEKKMFAEFNIRSSINSKISYTFFPTPRLKIKNIVIKDLFNENKSIGKANTTIIKLSFKNLTRKEKINFKNIFMNQMILKIDLNKFKDYKKYFSDFNKSKSIFFKNTNIEFYEGDIKVSYVLSSNIKYKFKGNKKIVELNGVFLNDNINIMFENDTKKRSKDISIKLKKNKLLVKMNLLNVEDTVKGKALLKKGKNKFTFWSSSR